MMLIHKEFFNVYHKLLHVNNGGVGQGNYLFIPLPLRQIGLWERGREGGESERESGLKFTSTFSFTEKYSTPCDMICSVGTVYSTSRWNN